MDSRNNRPVPVISLVELAKVAKLSQDPYIQRALVSQAVINDPGLANALQMKLGLRAVIELLDPFPFDIPDETEFER